MRACSPAVKTSALHAEDRSSTLRRPNCTISDKMSDLEKVVDKFSGFITKEQAEFILKSESEADQRSTGDARKPNMNVKELLNSISSKKPQEKPSENGSNLVNVKDRIYRIFNPSSSNIKGREVIQRTIILGEEGSTIVLSLRDKLAEFIDINGFERGDLIMVNNVVLDYATGELKSGQNTVINRISPSKKDCITDYSLINGESRKVDIIGRIVEISSIRHVTRLGKNGEIAVASCVITDSKNLIDASFWGSSAITTTTMKTNDSVKIEFCDIRNRDGKFQIYANDDSRVTVNNAFAKRLLTK